MKSVLAFVFALAIATAVHGQTCVNGVCSMDGRVTVAPSLPPIAPIMRSVLENQPVRRIAAVPLRYASHQVVQPTIRYGRTVMLRVIRFRSNARCR